MTKNITKCVSPFESLNCQKTTKAYVSKLLYILAYFKILVKQKPHLWSFCFL